MARNINQDTQVKKSQKYEDDLDMSNPESSSSSLEDDLNFIRTQLKLILSGPLSADSWHSEPAANLRDLSYNLGLTKKVTYYKTNGEVISVPVSQNYVALSTIGSMPDDPISVTSESDGAVCAYLPADSGVAHSLNAVANERNIVLIRDASTNSEVLDSSNRSIFGLLQVDSDATNGGDFTLAGDDSAQISFVVRDPSSESLIAAPHASIGGKAIEYAYQVRVSLLDAPENYSNSLDYFAKPVSEAVSIVDQKEDNLTIAFDGQVLYSLSQPPVSGGISTAYINGVAYYRDIDYTISGLTFEWLNREFQLETTDDLVVRYQV